MATGGSASPPNIEPDDLAMSPMSEPARSVLTRISAFPWEKLAEESRGLLELRQQHVRFLDATFRLFFAGRDPELTLTLARGVVGLLAEGVVGFPAEYAAASAGRHLLRLPPFRPISRMIWRKRAIAFRIL